MVYSKVVKRSSLLLSTVFSVFCIGCSQNSIDALTQAPIGKSELQNTLSTKSIEAQEFPETQKIEAPKGKAVKLTFKMGANEGQTEQSLEKRPCPPPPPPCAEKKDGQKAPQDTLNPLTNSESSEILTLKALSNEGQTEQSLEKRPCPPPPPPPCAEKKDVEKLGDNSNKDLVEGNKKACNKDEKKAPPPPPQGQNGQMSSNQNNQSGGQNQGQMGNNQGGNRQAPPPPPQGQNGQMNSNQNNQSGGQNQGQMGNNQGGNRKAPPPPQRQQGQR